MLPKLRFNRMGLFRSRGSSIFLFILITSQKSYGTSRSFVGTDPFSVFRDDPGKPQKSGARARGDTSPWGTHWSRPKTPENGLSGASRGIDARPLSHPFNRERLKGPGSVPITPFIGSVPPGEWGARWGRAGGALRHDVFRRSRASFDPAPSLSAKSCRDYPQRVLRGPGRFGSLPPGCRFLGFKGSASGGKSITVLGRSAGL